MKIALPASLAALLFAGASFAASAQQWQSRSIYQLLTDRFALDDGSSPPCDTSARKYCGGTWKGIINKLDYIQNMGFDAVWISPIVANVEGNTTYGEAFHGYWTQDINTLNSHFGTADDLKALAAALHARNMYLMLDVVVNHMASASDPPNYELLRPFSSSSDFHTECFVTNYDDRTNVEQCWLGDKNLPLADLDTENDGVVKTMNAWIAALVGNYSADGVRIDTVKHVRKDFWPEFVKSAGVYTLGEVFDPRVPYVAEYTQVVGGVLDYPTWYAVTNGFKTSTGNLAELAQVVDQSQKAFKDGQFMAGSFLENHDNPRFQSLIQDTALVKNAMTWPFVNDAIPILYYGQEQSYSGGNDPANREALWLSGYAEDKPLVKHVRSLNAARKAAIGANPAFLTTPVKFLDVTGSTLAVSKPPMLALLTNAGGAGATPSWTVPDAGYTPHEELVDVLTCTRMKADLNGGVAVQGLGGNPKVLVPISALTNTSKICAQVGGGQASSSGRLWRLHALPFAICLGLAAAFVIN